MTSLTSPNNFQALLPTSDSPQRLTETSHGSIAEEQAYRARSLQTTGLLYCEQGRYDTAVSCLESALSLWTVLGNLQAEQRLFKCLGHCYWQLGRFQTAQCCYQEAEILAQALSRSDRLGKLRQRLSQIFSGILL